MPIPILRVAGQLAHERTGVTALEYAIIMAIMVAVAATGANSMGTVISGAFTRIITALS